MFSKLRIAALGLAATAVLVTPAAALADDPEPAGTPAPWTYSPGQASGWTYNPGDQLQPTQGFKWTVKFNICEIIDC